MMFNDADRELIRQRAAAHLYTTELDDIIYENFEYCDECRENFDFITDRVWARGSYNKKEIGVAVKRLSPTGAIKIKTGGAYRYKIREKDTMGVSAHVSSPNKQNPSNTEGMSF